MGSHARQTAGFRHPDRWYTAEEGDAMPVGFDKMRSALEGARELPVDVLRTLVSPGMSDADLDLALTHLQASGAYDPAGRAVNVEGLLSWCTAGKRAEAKLETVVSSLPPRPASARGDFLRIVSLNDNYKFLRLPNVAMAIAAARESASKLGCVVRSTMNGDFLSPCLVTAIDGGAAMMAALDVVGIDYASLGNHEFDIGVQTLARQLKCYQRGKIINSNVTNVELSDLPKWDSFKVGDHTVVVGGFLSQDTSMYAPANTPDVKPVIETAAAVWDSAKAALGSTPDLFLPLTHQLVEEDKAMAKFFAKHEDLASRMPVILGGHEHEVFIDEAGKSTVVKVGLDCENIGIVDVWWTAEGQMRKRVSVMPADDFPLAAPVSVFVSEKEAFLSGLMSTQILTLDRPMSSKRVRFERSDIATLLLSIVKRALEPDGVEVVLVQGGAVRANAAYEPGPFCMGDLFKEFAFDTEQALIRLPGRIIAESILNTRSGPKPAPNFLHCDSDVVVTDEHVLTHINGKPLDADQIYLVSIYHSLLTGMNVIEPLFSYATGNCKIPDLEGCLPIKEIIMKQCMKVAWRELVGISLDADCDALGAKLNETISTLDLNKDGYIEQAELSNFVAQKMGGKSSAPLLEALIKALDTNGDGKVDPGELRAILH